MDSGKCPNNCDLEGYFYGHLPFMKQRFLKHHLRHCSNCRQRLLEIERFHGLFVNIGLVEAPSELPLRIMQSVRNCEHLLPSKQTRKPVFSLPVLSPKIRLAAGAVFVFLSILLKARFVDTLEYAAQADVIFGWGDLGQFVNMLKSGTLAENLRWLLAAFGTEGFSALKVLTLALPAQVFSVVVSSGVTAVVFLSHLRLSRSGGKKHEETVQVERT